MGRIECGDGEGGEPVGAHRADPDGRRRAGMPAGTWMVNWGGCEASAASRIFAVAQLLPRARLRRIADGRGPVTSFIKYRAGLSCFRPDGRIEMK